MGGEAVSQGGQAGRRKGGKAVRQEDGRKRAEYLAGVRLERKLPPVELRRVRPSLKPFAVATCSPDPYRGWGRYCLAHIRTQRAPVVSPVGAGTEYRRPDGSPDGSRGDLRPAKHQGTRHGGRENHRTRECATRDLWRSYLLAPRPLRTWRDAHTVAEGIARWVSRREAGRLSLRPLRPR
jgi:hypothetical protein